MSTSVETFVRILDVDEATARCLIEHQITGIEEVAYIPVAELEEGLGSRANLLPQLRQRARSYLTQLAAGRSGGDDAEPRPAMPRRPLQPRIGGTAVTGSADADLT